jgi:CheY-like chemotaxis protein
VEKHQPDLLLLDLSMPRKGGEDAFQEMRAINADVKVLLCCGYNEALANKKIASENLVGFLPKPFGLETLAHVVQSALKGK